MGSRAEKATADKYGRGYRAGLFEDEDEYGDDLSSAPKPQAFLIDAKCAAVVRSLTPGELDVLASHRTRRFHGPFARACRVVRTEAMISE